MTAVSPHLAPELAEEWQIRLRLTRQIVLLGMGAATAGSLLGFFFGVLPGQIRGPEAWLISAGLIANSILLASAYFMPVQKILRQALLISLYMGFYLNAGLALTLWAEPALPWSLPYLLWNYALLAFAKFTVPDGAQRPTLLFLLAAPLLVIAVNTPALLAQGDHDALMVMAIFTLSYLAFTFFLNLMSHYRVALAMQLERARGLAQMSRLQQAGEDRFHHLLDTAGVGFVYLDRRGALQYASRVFSDLTGQGRTQHLLGQPLSALLHEGDRADWQTGLERVLSGGETSHLFQLRLHTHDAIRHIQGALVRAEPRDGLAEALFLAFQDVTEQQDLGDRLRQAQKMEAVGQLTGGVAHDFNNLLTVILGNSEMLTEVLEPDHPGQSLAVMAATAAQRGAELTNRLLAFARRQALEPRTINLNRLVTGLEGLFRRTLTEDIDIEFVQAGGLWTVEIDPGQMEGALLNLVINARDAMPNGGRLTIETANTRLDETYATLHGDVVSGQYVMVSVSDSGTGMDAETLARVFDPFFTTKEVGRGTGLGLSMVYGFVKQSMGHAKIYSELGVGTTVKLYLPRAGGPPEDLITVPSAEPARGNGEHVLVVEDDPMVQEHVVTQLQALGYRVTSASNGPEALQLLERHTDVNLLFTDVVMPGGMTGRELANRACVLYPSLRVLFTSGYTENTIVHNGRLDPGVQLLQKPYRRQDLANKVHRVLSGPE